MKSIETESDYLYAIKAIDRLIHQKRRTTIETELLDILTQLVVRYDDALHYPTEIPDALSAIQFHMNQGGLTPRDLVPYIGTISKVKRILSGKRMLNKAMIRALHLGLGIPLASLRSGTASPVAAAEQESEGGIEL